MSDSCSGSCGSCSSDCGSAKQSREDLFEPANQYSKIKKVIGVVSGKGGVGKSFITSFTSVLMRRKGYETAILDADVTGPSIPKAFGIHKKVSANELGIFPGYSENGTKVMSVNLLLDTEETPVVWRGPIIAGTVKQFWSDVVWGDVDYMFVDMPPGTGDVPLTVFQSIPLDGIIVVTSPQEIVSMIVSKAVNMAKAMDVPVLGLVENYSYIVCGNCSEKISVFGESHVEETAAKFGLQVLGKIPIDPKIAAAVDKEKIEELEADWLDNLAEYLEKECPIEGLQEENPEISPAQKTGTTLGAEAKKIAVATDDTNNVYGHFGTCPRFTIYEMDGNILLGKSILESNGSGHSELAALLAEQNVDVLICGGIGSGALDALLKSGIIVIPGQQGDIEVAAAGYIDGSLLASDIPTCTGHDHQEGHTCNCQEEDHCH